MENKQKFVHLHLHSEYSLLDGACRIKDIPFCVKKASQSAVALTDHGVMYGAVDFYKACVKEGVKAIIGCEVYVAARSRFDKQAHVDSDYSHLVLLCKDQEGYKNLVSMVSSSFTEGFYSKPRVDLELLKNHSKGLIALSACLGGFIPKCIVNGQIKQAYDYANTLSEIFGKEDFYLEIQRHGISEQQIVNDGLIKMSKDLGIGLVATNDVHYLEKSDSDAQAVLMCIQTNTTLSQGRHKGFENDEFYLKSTQEMYQLFSDVPSALENTVKIADKCNFAFEFDKLFLPAFCVPDNLSADKYLEKLCKNGLEKRINSAKQAGKSIDTDEYVKRLEYELGVVHTMGYDEYYLIVNDFIAYAKDNGIPVGPGRGSGAGSLAAYCLGITDIDPIEHSLLFERFLNPERVSMPDFDVDFCYYRRQEVIDYVSRKYGKDHVAQIITFGTLAAKAAIRDVGRVMGIAYSEVDTLAKSIPFALNMTIDRALKESAQLREIYQNEPKLKAVVDIAKSIEGMPRNASTHAAGVVITDKPVSEYVPLSVNGDCVVTQYTMNSVADLGLLKIDFLGLRYLTVIHEAAKSSGLELSKIPLDDKNTYKMLSQGQSDGVFQLESAGMKNLLVKMVPKSIEDLTLAISLYRPGPMDSIPKFLENRKNPDKVKYLDEKLKPILDVTNGCIVYQEQVMQIFRTLAGYSLGRADIVRRAMAKKKTDVMNSEKQYFLYGKKDENGNTECEGAIALGTDEKSALEIYDDMSTFAQYAFNKSHAACYATLAYYSAYLKCHCPEQYMSSLLTSVLDRTEKVMEYISECNRMGIKVLSPDVNESDRTFSAKNGSIRFGLVAIKNVGENFAQHIVEKRRDLRYYSFEDFLTRISDKEINKRMIESLIKAGAFDSLGRKRRQLMATYEDAIDALQRRNRANVQGQFDMFSSVSTNDDTSSLTIEYPDVPEFSKAELLAMEKDISGIYMSGHPLERYKSISNSLKADKIGNINDAFEGDEQSTVYYDKKSVVLVGMVLAKTEKLTRNEKKMAFVDFEDMTGSIELIVFSNVYETSAHLFSKGEVLKITGEISVKETQADSEGQSKDEAKIIVKTVSSVLEDTKNTGVNNDEIIPSKTVKVNLSAMLSKQKESNDGKEGKQCLYLKVKSINDKSFERVKSVLGIYNYGNSPVYVYFEDTKKLTRAVGLDTFITNTQLHILSQILSEENVKVTKKKPDN